MQILKVRQITVICKVLSPTGANLDEEDVNLQKMCKNLQTYLNQNSKSLENHSTDNIKHNEVIFPNCFMNSTVFM